MIRLDPGEEVLTEVKRICEAEGILLGEFRALGAARYLEVGVYDVAAQEYFKESYEGSYEINTIFGTITSMNGEVYLHAHLSASTLEGKTIGGHLNQAIISGTCEMVLEPMEGSVGHRKSPITGLNEWDFESC